MSSCMCPDSRGSSHGHGRDGTSGQHETPTLQDLVDASGRHSRSHGSWPSPPRDWPPSKTSFESTRARGDLCELVDGVLVEKAMGLRESLLAGASWRSAKRVRCPSQPRSCHRGRRNDEAVPRSHSSSRCCVHLVGPIPGGTGTRRSRYLRSRRIWLLRFSARGTPRPR